MKRIELKPCPFCGAEPVMGPYPMDSAIIRCTAIGCPANPSVVGGAREGAARLWNKRADSRPAWRDLKTELPAPLDYVLLVIERDTDGLVCLAVGSCDAAWRRKDDRQWALASGHSMRGRVIGWMPMDEALALCRPAQDNEQE